MTEKVDDKLRVLILYGGEAATNPRHELLAWLRGYSLNVEARTVAESVPHSDGAIDDRVDEAMDWAHKAIALITSDERSEYGAPNIIDEIGRWRGRKGKSTLCLLRQKGVPIYSNHSGLVCASFQERVSEAFEHLRLFLADQSAILPPQRLRQHDGRVPSNPDIAVLVREIRMCKTFSPLVVPSVRDGIARLSGAQRYDFVKALSDILRNDTNDDVRRNVALVVEFVVEWSPLDISDELLGLMANDGIFSVRSCAAAAYCHLARSSPARVPLDILMRLISPSEDVYVVRPATTAMLYLARTRTIAVEALASLVCSDDSFNNHLAKALGDLVKIAPAALRDDIAMQLIKSGHQVLRNVGIVWMHTIKQRRHDGDPLDHYIV